MNGNQVRDWFEVAAIGKQLGFSWGGDWKWKDYPHLDVTKGISLVSFRAGKRPSVLNVPNRGYYGPGDMGKGVGDIQTDLIKAGYKLTKDQIYGQDTEAAVKAFQRGSNLVADGIWGKASQSAMDALLDNFSKPVVKPPVIKPTPPVVKPIAKPKEEEKVEAAENKNKVPKWAEKAWAHSKKKGYINDGRPNDTVTRAELAVILARRDGLKV